MSAGKIFVIDDDEAVCRLAKRALEQVGYEVQTTTHVIGVTAEVREFQPQAVLLDIMMPALTGDKLVELFSKTLKTVPKIILYSNKSADELRQLADDLNVAGYVCKIDGPAALVDKVGKFLSV